ncbi:MAG: hypothetical protein ACRBCJ_11595 [Hyphomicrobiaceae bacterium]
MLKFFLGLCFGLIMSVSYVRWGIDKPQILNLVDQLKGNIIATATDSQLYDVNAPADVKTRALEAYFRNSAESAAKIDAEFGQPFLTALYRRRVIREARQLRLQWTAFDKALAQTNLRAALENKHQTTDTIELKQAMLMHALTEQKNFLWDWMRRYDEKPSPETLLNRLSKLSQAPILRR